MYRIFSIGFALMLTAGCGDTQAPSPSSVAAKARESSSGKTSPKPMVEKSSQANSARQSIAGRNGETINPDGNTMVFLYHDLAGIKPSIEDWVEKDSRVQIARAADKASQRDKVKGEIESGLAAVRGIGVIRLTLSAGLSEYDPQYGEFTVQALAPSSAVAFEAFGEKVSLQFGNGKAAQTWRVPAAEAKSIRDKIGYSGVDLNASLRIKAVQPSIGGGTITADVLEYELRVAGSGGQMIGTVKVGEK